MHSSHMLVVEKVINNTGSFNSDPIRKPIAIITLEDIIERLISKQVGDEHDENCDLELGEEKADGQIISIIDLAKRKEKIVARKEQRLAAKEDVIQLFKEKTGSAALTEAELKAAASFLHEYVDPFKEIKASSVTKLV